MEHEQTLDTGEPVEIEAGGDSTDLEKNANLDNIVFALLFSADEPVSVRKLAAVVEDAPASDIKDAIERWRERFDQEAWSIRVEQVAGGYQLASRPDYAVYISRLYQGKRKFRLSRAALETLAIIAYKQPVTRSEIESVRGVASGGVVGNLMDRSLIRITGKARVLGAPFLYGTTPEFLEYLGLNSLGDLPSLEELEALLEKEAYPDETPESVVEAVDGSADVAQGAEEEEVGEEHELDFGGVVAALDAAKKLAAGAVSAAGKSDDGSGESSETPSNEKLAGAASMLVKGDSSGKSDGDELRKGAPPDIPTVEFEGGGGKPVSESDRPGEAAEPGDDDEDH